MLKKEEDSKTWPHLTERDDKKKYAVALDLASAANCARLQIIFTYIFG